MTVVHEDDAARCPHCAKELDPPDAAVCVHCGYNNITRMRAETKKVYAPDAADWITHLLPGIIAAGIVIGLIAIDIYCWVNMADWLEGSALQDDQADPVTGEKKYFVKPGAFIAIIVAISLIIILPAARFAIRRLVFNFKPQEKIKK
jgi:hypothetical protein